MFTPPPPLKMSVYACLPSASWFSTTTTPEDEHPCSFSRVFISFRHNGGAFASSYAFFFFSARRGAIALRPYFFLLFSTQQGGFASSYSFLSFYFDVMRGRCPSYSGHHGPPLPRWKHETCYRSSRNTRCTYHHPPLLQTRIGRSLHPPPPHPRSKRDSGGFSNIIILLCTVVRQNISLSTLFKMPRPLLELT